MACRQADKLQWSGFYQLQEDFRMLPINSVVCGNCVDIMSDWHDGVIDLTVTSPPYDNLRDYKGYGFDFQSIAGQLYRVTKPGGVVVWIVGDATIKGSETGTSFRQALYFKDIGFNLFDTMIYAKRGFANPSTTRYHQVFEYCFVLSKSKPKTFNPIKDRKNICTRRGGDAVRQKDGTIKKGNRGGMPLAEYGQRWNIWEYQIGGGNISADRLVHKHPAAFPEQLAADHIISWSNENDIVLDPMCGSGTTCKMAKQLDRNYIGIEISEEYSQLSRERILLTEEAKELKIGN